jgi:sodium/potassium-transporting ATPase subunit alpha
MFVYFTVLFQGGWHWGETLPQGSIMASQASTATFLGIVMMQVGTVFACRSERDSIFTLGFFSNKLVIWGIVAEIVLSAFIIYHPLGNRIFGSAPLDLWTWLLLIPCTVALLIAEEIRKYLVYRRTKR